MRKESVIQALLLRLKEVENRMLLLQASKENQPWEIVSGELDCLGP